MRSVNDAPSVRPLAEMLSSLRRKGVRLWAAGGQLRYRAPRGVLTPEEFAQLQEAQTEILALMEQSDAQIEDTTAVPRTYPLPAPLSFSQLAHWHVFRLDERPSVRPLALARRLCGPLRLDVFRTSLQDVVLRHGALRTRIVLRDGIPAQEVIGLANCEFEVLDLTALPESDRDASVKQAIDELILQPITVTTGPLFGVRLVRVRSDEHVLIVAMEHMISDAYSVAILLQDLLAVYAQRTAREPIALPHIPMQFAEFAIWLRNTHPFWCEKHGSYWEGRLRGAERVRFPDALSLSPESSQGWASVAIKIDKELRASLREWSRAHRTTLVMSIFTAYCGLVLRWCNVAQAVVRYQTDGRTNPKVANAIGYFATVLHLEAQLSDSDNFLVLLQRMTGEYCRAYEHADFSYIDSQIPKPAFAHNCCFNWIPQGPNTDLSRLKTQDGTISCHAIPFASPSLKFHQRDSEPVVLLYDVDEEVVGGVYFPVKRFPLASIERFERNFMMFLRRLLHEPEKVVPATLLP